MSEVMTELRCAENGSTQARLERENSAANKISEMLDRFKERPTLKNLRLVERYVNGDFRVFIAFRFQGANLVAEFQYCRNGRIDKHAETCNVLFVERSLCSRSKVLTKVEAARGRSDSQEKTVFVEAVEAMENPELVPLPSLVRFDTEERIYGVLPESLLLSLNEGHVLRGIETKGKVELSIKCARILDEQKLSSQVIKGGAEVLDCIPSKGGDAWMDSINSSQVEADLSSIRILLGFDTIGFGCAKDAQLAIEISDVLFGPFNFDVDQGQSVVG